MRNCLIFLIDESSNMQGPVARATGPGAAMLASTAKSKLESVGTALNSLLAQLQHIPDLDLGLIGYREDASGAVNVGARWPAALAEKDLICSSDLVGKEELIEQRPRRISLPNGTFDQQVIDFPVWYVPSLGSGSPQAAAYHSCCSVLDDWAHEANDPAGEIVIIHVMGEFPKPNDIDEFKCELDGLLSARAKPTVIHVQLGSHDNVPATLLSANRAFVPQGIARDMFDMAGVLPNAIIQAVRRKGVNVQTTARSLAFNARMIDFRKICDAVIEMLEPSEAINEKEPIANAPITPDGPDRIQPGDPARLPAGAETSSIEERTESDDENSYAMQDTDSVTDPDTTATISAESPCLVVFVLDKSIDSPPDADRPNACAKLSESLADTIGWLANVGRGAVDIGVVTYGAQKDGTPIVDVIETDGCPFVRDTQLASIAVRTEDHIQELPNGVGGLISIPRTQLYLADFQPAFPCPMAPAMAKVKEITNSWSSQQSSAHFPVTVVHLTHGRAEQADLSVSFGTLGESHAVVLYNFILTDFEHITIGLPENSDQVNENLHAYWEYSSPLLLRDHLAEKGKKAGACSRGLVINGDLSDLLQPVKCKLSQSA